MSLPVRRPNAWVLSGALWAALSCTPGVGMAAPDRGAEPPGADARKAKMSKPAAPKLTAPGGSGETASERSARLRRECKGRPNAGACSGHTD